MTDNRNTPVTTLERITKVTEYLHQHAEGIKKALKYCNGTHTFDDIVQGVYTERYAMVIVGDSFLILEVLEYPRTKHLHIFLAGGDLKELIDYVPKLEELAKANKCSMVTLVGRPGWQPALTNDNPDWQVIPGVQLGLPVTD